MAHVRWIVVGWMLLAVGAWGQGARTLTDMAGRRVTMPQRVQRVYAVNPMGTVLLYTLKPEVLLGWNYPVSADDRRFIQPAYRDLPVLGVMYGRNMTANLEELLRLKPDLFLLAVPANMLPTTDADQLQQRTRIPVVVVNSDLRAMPATYTWLGKVLAAEQRANTLSAYAARTLVRVQSAVKTIPAAHRRTVYYATGPDGLTTSPAGSEHTEILEFAGGVNVAALPGRKGPGNPTVSFEQVLAWQPDVIVVGFADDHTGGLYEHLIREQRWQAVKAVQRRAILEVPQHPFSWMDRPPSANRLLGLLWIAHALYPRDVHFDMTREVTDFYQLFYQHRVTPAELRQLQRHTALSHK